MNAIVTAAHAPDQRRGNARLRKQRQRERQREAARLAAEALADRQEKLAEHLAPSVMREVIMDSAGRMLIGSRVQIVNGRPVRALALGGDIDPVAHSRSPQITADHKRAARQLQLDWYDVGAGIGVGAVDYLRSGGGGGGEGGHAAIVAQIAARARLDGAMAHLGALAPSIARVVLDCIPVGVYADEIGEAFPVALELIVAGLSRLARFYWPPRDVGPYRIQTFGPSRAVYSVEVRDELDAV
jgi:hypothetical protein